VPAVPTTEEVSTSSYLYKWYKNAYLPEFFLRFRLPVFDNFTLRAGVPGLIIAGFLFALILVPVIYFKAWKNSTKQQVRNSNLTYALIFLAISGACYMILPHKLPGQGPLYERFSTIVVLALIISGSVLLRDVRAPLLRYFVLGATILYMALWTEYFISFNKDSKDFNPQLFAGIPQDAKLGGLIYGYTFRGRAPYMHFPNYYIVWNKGVAASKIIDYRFGVVRRGVKGDEIPPFNEWIGKRYKVEKVYDSTLHYFLVKGKTSAVPDSNLLNATLVREAGDWKLYSNNKMVPVRPTTGSQVE
jgi:hypothetical protein